MGGNVFFGRVEGMLGVSRAIGDYAYKPNGKLLVSPEPDIKSLKIEKETDFLVMACDGCL